MARLRCWSWCLGRREKKAILAPRVHKAKKGTQVIPVPVACRVRKARRETPERPAHKGHRGLLVHPDLKVTR